jgi:ethanolamine ammonia-lyase small subunit
MSGTPFDAWQSPRRLTAARIALGRTGGSLPTRELLAFGQAHAQARDAVHAPFDEERLTADLQPLGLEILRLATDAVDRTEYLRRPDLGRRLDAASRETLRQVVRPVDGFDLAVTLSDGLSAPAVIAQTPELLQELLPRLTTDGWRIAPLVIVRHGRVAVSDEVGELLGARISLVLLGERPGLGSADSLGAYFVHGPRPGWTDAERNCVSNIRPAGLPIPQAADTLHYLLSASRTRRLSGVQLKDDRGLSLLKNKTAARIGGGSG